MVTITTYLRKSISLWSLFVLTNYMLGHIALEQVTDYTVRGLICNKTVKLFIQDWDIFILHVATLHYTYAHLSSMSYCWCCHRATVLNRPHGAWSTADYSSQNNHIIVCHTFLTFSQIIEFSFKWSSVHCGGQYWSETLIDLLSVWGRADW